MNPWIGWALAAAALVTGYAGYGWRGVALGASVVVFWLLLQFNRAVRVMRRAGASPVGQVASAVMLNAKLRAGLRMIDVVTLTGSLGQPIDADAARAVRWRWSDSGGAAVLLVFERGRLARWTLERPTEIAATPGS